MPRSYGKLEVILQAVVDRIIDQIPAFRPETCFVNIDPDEIISNPGRMCCIVAPTSGTFSESMMDGGGAAQATVQSAIVVKIHVTDQRDQAGHGKVALMDSSIGLIILHRKLVKALVCFDPAAPVDDEANEQLRNPMMPNSYAYTRASAGKSATGPRAYSSVEQVFSVDYDMDFSE